jgi:hypothetical protein
MGSRQWGKGRRQKADGRRQKKGKGQRAKVEGPYAKACASAKASATHGRRTRSSYAKASADKAGCLTVLLRCIQGYPGQNHNNAGHQNKQRAFVSLISTYNFIFYMNVQEQIEAYITSQPEPKRSEMRALNRIILEVRPACKLWFLDGKNSENKTVSNPNIGYGLQTMTYADGKAKEFYQIGLSANTTGISVYILGIDDKTYLANTYGKKIGKASVTGYCIKFKTLKDINIDILEAAIRVGFEAQEVDKS